MRLSKGRRTVGGEDARAMEPLTGVCAERVCDRGQRDAIAALCERSGGALRAWRVAPSYSRTFAVVAGAFDERAAAELLGCELVLDRPPALYVALEPRDDGGLAAVEAALAGRGAPAGVSARRHGRALVLRLNADRTPVTLVRELVDIELAPRGIGCAFRLLSPVDLPTVARLAADGLGAEISAADVLEARL